MSIQNSTVNTANAAQIIDTTKDLASSPVGQDIMAGRHATTGETVRVTTGGKNDLMDALEELGMAKAGRSKVDTSKIKVKKGAGTDLDALGRIAEYLDKLPDLPKDQRHRELVSKFSQYEELFRRGGEELPTQEELRHELLKELQRYDSDITHRFAALEAMRADAAQRGAPEPYLKVLDSLRAEMRTPDAAREIVAGFRSAEAANALAEQTGGSAEDFRDTYRTILREGTNPAHIFQRMQSFSLTENLTSVLEGFIKVAGDDMASFGPSVDPRQLGDVLTELSRLKQMVSVLEMGKDLLGKAQSLWGSLTAQRSDLAQETDADPTNGWPSETELSGRMLDFANGPVASLPAAEKMLAGFPKDEEFRAMLINLVRGFHADLPKGATQTDAQIVQQKATLLTLSDKLVDLEQQTYA